MAKNKREAVRLERKQLHPVIFDMDGVIFDSERLLLDCWKIVADRHGVPDIEATLSLCLGVNVNVSRQIYFDRYGDDFPLDEYKEEVRAIFRTRCPGGYPPIKPGAKELLAWLSERGVPVALASSTHTAVVRRELDAAGLLPYFTAVICGDQVSRSKPEPDIFLKAAEALGAEAPDCFIIEDSFNGVRAAYAAGARTIMVPDVVPPDEEMREKAEVILPSLDAAREYLSSRL